MYNNFKNDFVTNIYSAGLQLNQTQIKNILESLDKTSKMYDIFSKTNGNKEYMVNGIPSTVYDYINTKRAEGCAQGTLYVYRLMLEVFFHNVPKNPEYITSDDIRDFLMQYQKTNPVSNRTLDKYRGYICAYFAYLHDYGYIPRNPGKQVNPIRYEIRHKDVLTEYECELLREACNTKRELAMIEFLIATACRIGELVRVKLSDIDWDNNTCLVFGKGSKDGIVFFNARCKIALKRYLEERQYYGLDSRYHPESHQQAQDSEYLFIYDRAPYNPLTTKGAEKIITNIVARCEEISNKHITAHRLRASTASNLFNKGMQLSTIQHILRHESPITTEIYIENNIRRVQNEYNKYM